MHFNLRIPKIVVTSDSASDYTEIMGKEPQTPVAIFLHGDIGDIAIIANIATSKICTGTLGTLS